MIGCYQVYQSWTSQNVKFHLFNEFVFFVLFFLDSPCAKGLEVKCVIFVNCNSCEERTFIKVV